MQEQKKRKSKLAQQVVFALCIGLGAFSAQAFQHIRGQICNDSGDYCCDDVTTGACCVTTPGHLCG